MKRFGSFAGVAFTVVLLVSACSQAPKVQDGLEAQFGSPRDDNAEVVATDIQRGRIYLGGKFYNAYDSSSPDRGEVVFFQRYDRNGRRVWKVSANTERQNIGASVKDVTTDRVGNVYFGWNTYSLNNNSFNRGLVSKYSPTGRQLFQKKLEDDSLRGLASDASGNFYVTSSSNHVRKHSSNGNLIWDRVLTEKDFQGDSVSIFDVEALADGSLYIGATYEGGFGSLLLKLRASDGKLVKTIKSSAK